MIGEIFMKTFIKLAKTILFGFAFAASSFANAADQADDTFLIRSSARTPEQVVAAIKSYVEEKKWLYLGDNKVKNGEVTLVKFCVPAAGKEIWGAGLQASALAPCGNVGVYKKDGATTISMLNPKFMNVVYPNPGLKKAGDELLPQFTEMLSEIVK